MTVQLPIKGNTVVPKIGVFIDVQNVFYSANELFGKRLKYGSLLSFIKDDREIVDAIAYIVETKEYDQSGFIDCLNDYGYTTKNEQHPYEMVLAMDVIRLAVLTSRVNVVAIVTGNGIYTELVEFLTNLGIYVEIYGFGEQTSHRLKKKSTTFFDIPPEMLFDPTINRNK